MDEVDIEVRSHTAARFAWSPGARSSIGSPQNRMVQYFTGNVAGVEYIEIVYTFAKKEEYQICREKKSPRIA